MCQINFIVEASFTVDNQADGRYRKIEAGSFGEWVEFAIPNYTNAQTPNLVVEGDYQLEVSVDNKVNWFLGPNFCINPAEISNTNPTARISEIASSITLPTNSIQLSGDTSEVTTAGATLVTYLWTKVSGGVTDPISTASADNVTVTGLEEGSYTFRLTVTDSNGLSNSVTKQLLVNKAIPVITAINFPNGDCCSNVPIKTILCSQYGVSFDNYAPGSNNRFEAGINVDPSEQDYEFVLSFTATRTDRTETTTQNITIDVPSGASQGNADMNTPDSGNQNENWVVDSWEIVSYSPNDGSFNIETNCPLDPLQSVLTITGVEDRGAGQDVVVFYSLSGGVSGETISIDISAQLPVDGTVAFGSHILDYDNDGLANDRIVDVVLNSQGSYAEEISLYKGSGSVNFIAGVIGRSSSENIPNPNSLKIVVSTSNSVTITTENLNL